jgi:hypothetical protein
MPNQQQRNKQTKKQTIQTKQNEIEFQKYDQ